MLLGFLDEEPAGIKDFYVRYHTVQLLTALAAGGPYRLQGVSSTFLVPTSCFRNVSGIKLKTLY